MTEVKIKPPKFWQTMVTMVIVVLLRAYVVMLAMGIIHLQWTAAVPALSLWECVALSTAFAFIKR